MAKKAVYNNQYLAIYITQKEFDELIRNLRLNIPLLIGKGTTSQGVVTVDINFLTSAGLAYARQRERDEQETVRREFKQSHPNYKTYEQRKGKKKHGK